MKNLIPFDLDAALKGEPVITRQGKPVTQIKVFDTKEGKQPIAGVLEGEINIFSKDGAFNPMCAETCLDLFMAPKPVERFVNVYEGDHRDLHTALHSKCEGAIACLKVTIHDGEISTEVVFKY